MTVPKIVRADVLEIYLQEFNNVSLRFWKLSPKTDKNEMLQPRLVYGFPLKGENWPSMKETTGRFTVIFRYFTLWQGRLSIASLIEDFGFFIFCKFKTKTLIPLHAYPSSFICSISPIDSRFFKSRPPSSNT